MKITVKGVQRMKRRFDPKLLEASLSRGLNRTMTTAIKEASKAVRGVYNIKAGDVKKSITVKRARVDDLVAVIEIRSKPISLYAFGGKAYIAKRKGQKIYFGASAKIKKSERRKKYKGAFVAEMNGRTGIYRRKGKKRFPISQMRVISATTMFRKYGVDKIESIFEEVFLERVMKDYRYRIDKIGG